MPSHVTLERCERLQLSHARIRGSPHCHQEPLQGIKIVGKGRSPLLRQMVGRLRTTANEGFFSPDVFGFFEFQELQPQATVCDVEPLFQSGEGVRSIELECGQHT